MNSSSDFDETSVARIASLVVSRIEYRLVQSLGVILIVLLSMLGAGTASQAQDEADFEGDKTGTNPINFTFDFRVYNEYIWLNTPGDSTRNVTTLEYRQPFLGGKWQFRTRIRATGTDIDINDDGISELDSYGLGEVDFRFLTVPYLNMEKRFALAVGLETFLPTGNAIVGSETLSFGPQVFGVFTQGFHRFP